MFAKLVYPTNLHMFRKFLRKHRLNNIYNEIGRPTPFDVTLRDGLQGLSREDQSKYTTIHKLKLYHNILKNYEPKDIEIGSIVSNKVLPIFKDTVELFESAHSLRNGIYNYDYYKKHNLFVLIPHIRKLENVFDYRDIMNFSFVTSASNQFQIKNTKMTLDESDTDIRAMVYELQYNKPKLKCAKMKLYVSCINECPIIGKINNNVVIDRLLLLNNMNVSQICLSDTCGTLTKDDFEYIVDTCANNGMPLTKVGLHLHVGYNRETEVEKIIHSALDRKITKFDVSFLESGGCSVTMNNSKLTPNLSYELYYRALCNYLIKMNKNHTTSYYT